MGPRLPHGPALKQGDLCTAQAGDRRLDVVVPAGCDPVENALHPGRHKRPVGEGGRLRNGAEQIAGGEPVADGGDRRERPATLSRQRLAGGTPDQEIRGGGQRPQHPVEDAPQQTRPELGRERKPAARDGLSGGQSARVFVDLDGRAVALHGDDLAWQTSLADGDDLEHGGSVHGRRLDDRAVHPQDSACHAHNASTSVPSSSRTRSTSVGKVASMSRCLSRAITPPAPAGSRSMVAPDPRHARASASRRSRRAS